nr:hypothetical protein GCM10020092_074310 [Actinoplanes digitatis]
MDQRTEDFIAAFQIFLDEVVANHREGAQADGDRALAPILHEHLGADPRSIAVVGEEMPAYRFVDLDIALAELQDRDGEAQLLGIGGGEQRNHHSLGELLEMAGRFQQFPVGAVDYASVATGPQSTREAVSFGLRLFSYGASPVAVLQRAAAARYGSITARMEILSPAPGVAAALIAEVRELMVLRSVFRGQVLTLGGSDFEPGVGGITFHRRSALAPDDIVLPDGMLDRLHRHVAGVARHRERLRAARPAPQARPAALRPAGHRQDAHRAVSARRAARADRGAAVRPGDPARLRGRPDGPRPPAGARRAGGLRPGGREPRPRPGLPAAAVRGAGGARRAQRRRRRGIPAHHEPGRRAGASPGPAPRPGRSGRRGAAARPAGPPPAAGPLRPADRLLARPSWTTSRPGPRA